MRNEKYKILKTIVKLEKQKLKPTTDAINKVLKSKFEQSYIATMINEGLITYSYLSGQPHIYVFHSVIKTKEYLDDIFKKNLTFWITIFTFFITAITLILTCF